MTLRKTLLLAVAATTPTSALKFPKKKQATKTAVCAARKDVIHLFAGDYNASPLGAQMEEWATADPSKFDRASFSKFATSVEGAGTALADEKWVIVDLIVHLYEDLEAPTTPADSLILPNCPDMVGFAKNGYTSLDSVVVVTKEQVRKGLFAYAKDVAKNMKATGPKTAAGFAKGSTPRKDFADWWAAADAGAHGNKAAGAYVHERLLSCATTGFFKPYMASPFKYPLQDNWQLLNKPGLNPFDSPSSNYGNLIDYFLLKPTGEATYEVDKMTKSRTMQLMNFVKQWDPEEEAHRKHIKVLTDHDAVSVRLRVGGEVSSPKLSVMTVNMQFMEQVAKGTTKDQKLPASDIGTFSFALHALLNPTAGEHESITPDFVLVEESLDTGNAISGDACADFEKKGYGAGENTHDLFGCMMHAAGFELVISGGYTNGVGGQGRARREDCEEHPTLQPYEKDVQNSKACAESVSLMTVGDGIGKAKWHSDYMLTNQIWKRRSAPWEVKDQTMKLITSGLKLKEHTSLGFVVSHEGSEPDALEASRLSGLTRKDIWYLPPRSIAMAKLEYKGPPGAATSVPAVVVGATHVSGGRFDDRFFLHGTGRERTKQGEKCAKYMLEFSGNADGNGGTPVDSDDEGDERGGDDESCSGGGCNR